MSNQGITRWERGRSGGWVEGEGGMLSALNIQYTFDGETQREVIHAVYPGLQRPYDSKLLVNERYK